jgi:hypothetical protein
MYPAQLGAKFQPNQRFGKLRKACSFQRQRLWSTSADLLLLFRKRRSKQEEKIIASKSAGKVKF